jgi:hypothetical protein
MDLDKFLNLLATIFGTLGAVYVMLSILAASPELMLSQARTHYDSSLPQIKAMASQKGDNISGFVFVVIAFVLAAVTIACVPEGVRIFDSKWLALAFAAVLAGGLFATLHFISQGIGQHQKIAMCKILTSEYLDEIINRGHLQSGDSAALSVYAQEFLELTVSPGESPRLLFQRLAAGVGKTLPSTIDYSAVEPKP